MAVHPDLIRVLHREAGSTDAWVEVPYFTAHLGGIELQWWVRRALPGYGEAELVWHGGYMETIGGAKLAGSEGTVGLNGEWDPATNTLATPDLIGHEIRIQHAPYTASPWSGARVWRTMWHGVVAHRAPEIAAAAAYPMGSIVFRAVDAFAWWARRWPLDRHGLKAGAYPRGNLDGHPGYNVDQRGALVPNRDSSGSTWEHHGQDIDSHVHAGDTGYGTWWTDADVCVHALRIGRRSPSAPAWHFSGAVDLLSGISPWPVPPGLRAWDLIAAICSPERCLGVVIYDWGDDSADPLGALPSSLNVGARSWADITYTRPSTGAGVTIEGAHSRAGSVDLNFIGDVQVAGFSLSDRAQYVFDYIETVGGALVCTFTVSHLDGTLQAGWATSEATARASAPDPSAPRYAPVFALHALPVDWDGRAGDGNGGSLSAALVVCGDSGVISPAAAGEVSPAILRLARSLPLLEGVDYTLATPARYDAADQSRAGSLRRPMVFLRLANNSFVDAVQVAGVELRITPEGLWVVSDQIGQPAEGIGVYSYDQIAVTVAVEIPSALRMATGDASGTVWRTQYPELEVHTVHPGAILDLDAVSGRGFTAKRRSTGGMIVHDDRDRLAWLHALNVAWHGADRVPVRWSRELHSCAEDQINLGQCVGTVTAGGEHHIVRTPVVEVSYDHTIARKSWVTEWHGADFTRVSIGG